MEGFFYRESTGNTLAHNCVVCKNKGNGEYAVNSVIETYDEYENYLFNIKQHSLLEDYRKGEVLSIYRSYAEKITNKLPDEF